MDSRRGSWKSGSVSSGVVVSIVTALVVLSGLAFGPARAWAATPTADCQPYSGRPCLLPYPDNRLTRRDPASVTGLRVNLPPAAMPVNVKGVRVRPAPYDGNDGFSPGSAIVLHIPGLDTPAALRRTGAVPLTDMAQTYAKRQPIVVIDQATGRRQLIWAELDSNAPRPSETDLLIHPGRDFSEGHTYIVALRDLRTASGRPIHSPRWFRLMRAGVDGHRSLPAAERGQRARYAGIFSALHRAGISTGPSLYETWSFTVDSSRSLTGRMLAIRDSAFAQLGDHDLADSVPTGRAPAFTVTSTEPLASPTGAQLTEVDGTFEIPCYLKACGPKATPGFHDRAHALYATPTQSPGRVATSQFECVVPSEATPSHPARISLYGHGLLGSRGEVTAGNVETMATVHNMTFCATNFWGLADGDTLNDAAALSNLNRFPAVVDRLQQGALNTLYLGRLMLRPTGLASSPAFQQDGRPVIDGSHLYYDGNSQGGIMGGFLTAVAPDWRHAVLGVTGMDYANLLVQRSTDFAPFGKILYAAYRDPSSHPLVLDLMEQLWDRGDPDGYAQQMTSDPLPDTPTHQVLMQIAYGDHQVSMYAAAVEARTIGASAYRPALDLSTNRRRDRHLFYGLPSIRRFPFAGSAIEVWDSGPGNVSPPPLGNLPPVTTSTGPHLDPHEDPRSTPAAQEQKSAFLSPGGRIIDVCGGRPCRSHDFRP